MKNMRKEVRAICEITTHLSNASVHESYNGIWQPVEYLDLRRFIRRATNESNKSNEME